VLWIHCGSCCCESGENHIVLNLDMGPMLWICKGHIKPAVMGLEHNLENEERKREPFFGWVNLCIIALCTDCNAFLNRLIPDLNRKKRPKQDRKY